ncbi:MAG TPA: hypothetical protein VF914_18715 [Chloroflexia bacterium]
MYNSLFYYNVTVGGFNYDHVRTDNEYTPHSGSNNYECTAFEGSSNGCTSGNKTNPVGSFIVSHNNNRNQINDYDLVDRQLTWTQASKDKLVTLVNSNSNIVDALVFHAFKWDSRSDCTDGEYVGNPTSDLPGFDPANHWRTFEACTFGAHNEIHVYIKDPNQLVVAQEYTVRVVWSTNTDSQGEFYTGQLTSDNYLVEINAGGNNRDKNFHKDYMTKFCYSRDIIGECPR